MKEGFDYYGYGTGITTPPASIDGLLLTGLLALVALTAYWLIRRSK